LISNSHQNFDTLTELFSSQMFVGQTIQVKTASIEANYFKSNNISALNTNQNVQDCSIKFTSFCDLINQNCSNRTITQNVIFSTILKGLNHSKKVNF
jgi:hypothetical protein